MSERSDAAANRHFRANYNDAWRENIRLDLEQIPWDSLLFFYACVLASPLTVDKNYIA